MRNPDTIQRLWWSRWTFRFSLAVVLALLIPALCATLYLIGCVIAAAFRRMIYGPWNPDWSVIAALAFLATIVLFLGTCFYRVEVERENPYR